MCACDCTCVCPDRVQSIPRKLRRWCAFLVRHMGHEFPQVTGGVTWVASGQRKYADLRNLLVTAFKTYGVLGEHGGHGAAPPSTTTAALEFHPAIINCAHPNNTLNIGYFLRGKQPPVSSRHVSLSLRAGLCLWCTCARCTTTLSRRLHLCVRRKTSSCGSRRTTRRTSKPAVLQPPTHLNTYSNMCLVCRRRG